MRFVPDQVRVRVPATSANLGPGFDALGLALDLHDEVTVRATGAGLTIAVEGEGSGTVPTGETHLVVQSMYAAFDELGGRPDGLALRCVNRIPHARGLGSSAAAIVAGVLAARALVADGATRLPDERVLNLAAALEGHPDNVAATLLGGLTVAWTDPDGARAVRVPTADGVQPVVLIAPTPSATEVARGALPATVPHGDAAFAAGRSALLVAALSGAPDLLYAATEDRLHQPYRAASIPQTASLVDRLRTAGLPAVVSGAGPTVLVLARDRGEVETALSAAPADWIARALPVARSGATAATAGTAVGD